MSFCGLRNVVEILVERDFLQSSGEGTARMVGLVFIRHNNGGCSLGGRKTQISLNYKILSLIFENKY